MIGAIIIYLLANLKIRMASYYKILVLFPDEEHQQEYNKLKGIETAFGDNIVKTLNFSQFQDGKSVDVFDLVIAFAQNTSTDDFEMQADFWGAFTIAPVFSILHNSAPADWIKQNLSDSAVSVESSSSDNYVQDLKSAFDQSVALYKKKLEEDVTPAFKKFDKDGSGAIDRNELQSLMKDLGQELNEEQTTKALKDLDLN